MKRSAGLILYRAAPDGIELLLVHPGGPFWARRDEGAWSIPKGEYGPEEEPLAAALREFAEETGTVPPRDGVLPLGEVVQAGGKRVAAFAVEGDLDPAGLVSATCEIEWPPRSGRPLTIPEVDRAAWFGPDEARRKIGKAQAPFVDRLLTALRA